MEKKSTKIAIKIQGLKAEFNVFLSTTGSIILLNMYIGDLKINYISAEKHFKKHYKSIKKQFFKQYGEIA